MYYYVWIKHGRFPNEIRKLPINEQMFVLQCIIQEMQEDTEMMKELKGRQTQLDLKQLMGKTGARKRGR